MTLRSRLARLEAAHPKMEDMPRFWVTPSWCELNYAEGHPGEVFHREPEESKEAFMVRVEASTNCPCLLGFKPMTSEQLETITQGQLNHCKILKSKEN